MSSKTITIKKGNHYASGRKFFPFITKKNFTVAFYFTNSCRYSGSDQLMEQWNKLFGIGALQHHKNSDRIAWRYNDEFDLIELSTYKYKNGERMPIKSLGFVAINTWNSITINTERYWFGRKLNPYFGGKESVPHNIKIKINEKRR